MRTSLLLQRLQRSVLQGLSLLHHLVSHSILPQQPLTLLSTTGIYHTCRSLWHAPDRDGRMEVQLLPGQLPPGHKWPRQQSITALQAPNVTTELQVAEFISSTVLRGWPLLNCLMQQQQQQQQQTLATAGAATGSSGASAEAGAAAAAERPSSSAAAEAEQQMDGGRSGSGSDSNSDAPAARSSAKRSKQRSLISFSSDEDDGWDSSTDDAGKQAAGADAGADAGAGAKASAAARGAAGNSNAGSAVSDDDDNDDFAAPLPARTLLQQQGVSKKARLSKVDAAAAASGADLSDAFDDWDDEAAGKQGPSDNPSSSAAAGKAAGPLPDANDATAGLQAQAEALLAEVVQRFRLNDAQAAVAAHVADWLPQLMLQPQGQQQQHQGPGPTRQGLQRPGSSKHSSGSSNGAVNIKLQARGQGRSPVCLIHGPFGSGKSTLLVALIHLVTGLVPGVSDVQI
jgi:hypothetical protein